MTVQDTANIEQVIDVSFVLPLLDGVRVQKTRAVFTM